MFAMDGMDERDLCASPAAEAYGVNLPGGDVLRLGSLYGSSRTTAQQAGKDVLSAGKEAGVQVHIRLAAIEEIREVRFRAYRELNAECV